MFDKVQLPVRPDVFLLPAKEPSWGRKENIPTHSKWFFLSKKKLGGTHLNPHPPSPQKNSGSSLFLANCLFRRSTTTKKRPKKIITKWPSRNDLQPGTGYRGSLVGVRRLMMDKFSHVQRRQWKWCEGPNSVGEPSRILEVVSDRINQNTHEKKWIRSVCFFVCIFYIYM